MVMNDVMQVSTIALSTLQQLCHDKDACPQVCVLKFGVDADTRAHCSHSLSNYLSEQLC